MKTAALISIENSRVSNTIVSLKTASVMPDLYIFLVNNQSPLREIEILIAVTSDYFGNTEEVNQKVDGKFIINAKGNIILVQNKEASFIDLMNYTKDNLINDIDIIMTATSGEEFDYNYLKLAIKNMDNPYIGLVYSDYIDNKTSVHLQYINPMLSNRIEVKEYVVKKSILAGVKIKSDPFNVIAELFSKTLIKHIPEELYKI